MRRILVAIMGVGLMTLGFAAPASAASTNQRFTLLFHNDDPGVFAGTGPINGVGKDTSLSEVDNPDGSFTAVERIDYPKGSFKITVNGHETSSSFNEDSCVFRFTGAGTAKVSGGTGIYSGISGNLTFTFRGGGSAPKENGECSEDEGSFSVVVRGRGHVDL